MSSESHCLGIVKLSLSGFIRNIQLETILKLSGVRKPEGDYATPVLTDSEVSTEAVNALSQSASHRAGRGRQLAVLEVLIEVSDGHV
jgi:hypothetical protein